MRGGNGIIFYQGEHLILESYPYPNGFTVTLWCRLRLTASGYATVGVVYRITGTHSTDSLIRVRRWATDSHCLVLGDFSCSHAD